MLRMIPWSRHHLSHFTDGQTDKRVQCQQPLFLVIPQLEIPSGMLLVPRQWTTQIEEPTALFIIFHSDGVEEAQYIPFKVCTHFVIPKSMQWIGLSVVLSD